MLNDAALGVLRGYIKFLLESGEIDESSGAGAAMGFSAPLGVVPAQPQRKLNRRGKKKKNRK